MGKKKRRLRGFVKRIDKKLKKTKAGRVISKGATIALNTLPGVDGVNHRLYKKTGHKSYRKNRNIGLIRSGIAAGIAGGVLAAPAIGAGGGGALLKKGLSKSSQPSKKDLNKLMVATAKEPEKVAEGVGKIDKLAETSIQNGIVDKALVAKSVSESNPDMPKNKSMFNNAVDIVTDSVLEKAAEKVGIELPTTGGTTSDFKSKDERKSDKFLENAAAFAREHGVKVVGVTGTLFGIGMGIRSLMKKRRR